MSRLQLSSALLKIHRMVESDAREPFTCDDSDLDDFFRMDAHRLQTSNVVKVYVARYDGKLVGFLALLGDAVTLQTEERKKLRLKRSDPPPVPALKIGRLAVEARFSERHSGMGTALVRFALDRALVTAEDIGCRLLTSMLIRSQWRFMSASGSSATAPRNFARPILSPCASTSLPKRFRRGPRRRTMRPALRQ